MTEDDLMLKAAGCSVDVAVGENDGVPGYWLHWRNPHNSEDGECSFLPTSSLPEADWDKVFTYVVNGRNVDHVSRVVGYFSKVHNWNPSKHGELKDRQAGKYGI